MNGNKKQMKTVSITLILYYQKRRKLFSNWICILVTTLGVIPYV